MSGTFKKIVIILVAIGLIILVVSLAKKSPEEGSLVSSVPTGSGIPIGNTNTSTDEFLVKLLSIQTIKLDDSIFLEPGFNTLRDSSIELIHDGTEGRSNPFAPIGFENIANPTSRSQNTTTPSSGTGLPNQ